MRSNKLILPIAISLSLSACSFKTEDAKQKEAAKASADTLNKYEQNQDQKKQSERDGGRLTDQNITVDFIELPQPGYYKMRISWPQSVVAMTVQVDDEFESTTEQKNFFERTVEQGTTYRLRLTSKSSDGIEISRKELIKTAPKDKVLNENWSLKENSELEVNRLYFYPHAKIITNGYNLAIRAKTILVFKNNEVDDSGIFTSEANIVTALPPQIARESIQLKGSEISITADQAIGKLQIALLGLDGQDGRNGDELDREGHLIRDIDPNLNGQNGRDGQLQNYDSPCTKKFKIDVPCDGPTLICKIEPTNGQDGKTGTSGTPGENGQPGGDSGNLFIDVKDSSKFSVEVGQRVGQPGHGGQGGAGSPGGIGGKAGKSPGAPCPITRDGRNGSAGPQGGAGETGPLGKLGSVTTGSIKARVFPL